MGSNTALSYVFSHLIMLTVCRYNHALQ